MATVPFPGFNSNTDDDALVNPATYTDEAAIHALYAKYRARGMAWAQPVGFRPFWAVTRHADILAVSKANDRFINRERTYLSPAEGEEWIKSMTGDTHLFRTLVDLDDPEHRKLRALTNAWFQPGNVRTKLEGDIRALAREHVEAMRAGPAELDFVTMSRFSIR